MIGRAQEIETTIEVLARRKKNNPVLIGEPGVGKPPLSKVLLSASLPAKCRRACATSASLSSINSMVAGSKYRGEFEERVQQILKEVTEREDELVLFIDEIHTIVGAARAAAKAGSTSPTCSSRRSPAANST